MRQTLSSEAFDCRTSLGLVLIVVLSLLSAIASAFNVAVVRGSEFEKGVEVTDKNGNVVGISQAAGTKVRLLYPGHTG